MGYGSSQPPGEENEPLLSSAINSGDDLSRDPMNRSTSSINGRNNNNNNNNVRGSNNKLSTSTISTNSMSNGKLSQSQQLSTSQSYQSNKSGDGLSKKDVPKPSIKERLRTFLTPATIKMGLLLLSVVFVGTANRVSFRVMLYGTINYSYFVSQFTSFVFIPIFFTIIWIKQIFTDHITPEQTSFPKYKFAVMGLLDALQGLLIVVGGNQVPGMMQNLLLQGVVPVTMITSILFLRPTGCDKCKAARKYLKDRKVKYTEQSTHPVACTDEQCKSWIQVSGTSIKGTDLSALGRILDQEFATMPPQLTLYTSSKSWKVHLKEFYSIFQYIGAVIILSGLVVSVYPAVTGNGNGGGPVLWDMIFFTATIPTALSAVYKEIAFRSVEDMDVWYLNGWVSLFQFLIGLTYAPLAAYMVGLPISDIPMSIVNGTECVFLGKNFILPNETITSNGQFCVYNTTSPADSDATFCDSCDGSFPFVSSITALEGMMIYLTANLAYNVVLVMVIKYGSAALMYVASTVVLPLGAISFTIPLFLGKHATDFSVYDGSGLGLVLFGLIIYRFLGILWNQRKGGPKMIISANNFEPAIVATEPVQATEQFKPRSLSRTRSDLYSRLGLFDHGSRAHQSFSSEHTDVI